ncbi:MAG TPA: nitroreductase family protein [Selenomonadales bacterium]|nr:nitroreductase family protein [Selenomonadales bacterium]
MIEIDKAKCQNCNLCFQTCPYGIINPGPHVKEAANAFCIECGQCYAVCPGNAVTVCGCPDEEQPGRPADIAAEAMLDLLQNRRSTRLFQPLPVADEHMEFLIRAASVAPSATNLRQVKAYVVRNTSLIGDIRIATTNYYASLQRMFTLPGASLLARIQGISRARMERVLPAMLAITNPPEGKDPLFYNARTLVVFTVPKSAGEETVGDAWIAAQNMVIAAETIPVGSCYNGFLSYAAHEYPYLKKLMGVSEDEKVVTSLLLGYPGGRYLRRPHREMMPTVWK